MNFIRTCATLYTMYSSYKSDVAPLAADLDTSGPHGTTIPSAVVCVCVVSCVVLPMPSVLNFPGGKRSA